MRTATPRLEILRCRNVFGRATNLFLQWLMMSLLVLPNLTFNAYAGADSSDQYFEIRNRATGKALSDQTSCNAAFALHQPCATDFIGESSQQWSLAPADEGYFHLINKRSMKALAGFATTCADGGACLALEEDRPSDRQVQQWSLVPVKGGYFKIVNRSTSKVLAVPGSPSSAQMVVQQATYFGSGSQEWSLVMADPGVESRSYDPDPDDQERLFRTSFSDSCSVFNGTWVEDTTPPTTWQITQHDEELTGNAVVDYGSICGTIRWKVSGAADGGDSFALIVSEPSVANKSCDREPKVRIVKLKLSYPGCKTGIGNESLQGQTVSTTWSRTDVRK